jgi:hypothetical protein
MSYAISSVVPDPRVVSSASDWLPAECLTEQALAAARNAVHWLGIQADQAALRRCAAARLRYASLLSADNAGLMRDIAVDLEQGGSGSCRCCGRRIPA